MRIRIILVTILLIYTFISLSRSHFMRISLFIGGLGLVSLGFVSIYSPGLFGYLNNWILIGDSLTLVEIGIISIILSSELTSRKTEYLSEMYYYLRLLFENRYERYKYFYLIFRYNISLILQNSRGLGLNINKFKYIHIKTIARIQSNVPP